MSYRIFDAVLKTQYLNRFSFRVVFWCIFELWPEPKLDDCVICASWNMNSVLHQMLHIMHISGGT